MIINGYEIGTDKLFSVIDIFSKVNSTNIDEFDNTILNLFSNLEKGFLYEETIYRVKKNDK